LVVGTNFYWQNNGEPSKRIEPRNVGTKCGPQVSFQYDRDSASKKELATFPLVMHDCVPDYIYGHIQQELDCGKRYISYWNRHECTTGPMLRLMPGRLGRFSAANYYKMMGTSEIMMSYKLNLTTVDTLF